MFSHVSLGTDELDRATAFYDAVLRPLGLIRVKTLPEYGAAGWGAAPGARPQFWVTRPYDGAVATVGNGAMAAFAAPHHAAVQAVHAAALEAGGTDEGAPGPRAHYHPNYYGAYFRDPDGNKLCVVCHAAPDEGRATA